MQNKNEGNENKIMLGDSNCTMDKIDGDGVNKTKTVPIMPCLNSSWIMVLRIYGGGKTQIFLSSSATIGPLTRISIDKVYTDIKNC